MKQILHTLKIPLSCQMEKSIPIGTFLANMDGTPKDKLNFKNAIAYLTIQAQINPEDVNLSSVITEEEHYQAILFLEVGVKSLKELAWIDEKIHASIPQPTFVFFTKDNNLRISAPSKRINKVYRSKTVVESYWLTPQASQVDLMEFIHSWFDEKAAYKIDLKSLYIYIQNLIQVFQYRNLIGDTRAKLSNLATLTNQLHELEKNEATIRLDYEHANMKKEKLIFHKQLTEIQNHKNNVISKLKGE
jgi:hypothetical protein